MLKELLEAGIIERGTSYTSCPAFLVKKPAYIGKSPAELKDIPNHKLWRLVLDFRALNRVTEPNSYPTPNVADTVRSLREVTLRSHEYDQKHNIKPDWEGATPHDPKGSLSSSLDWSSAFFTQPTHFGSKKLTCFVIPGLGSFLFRGAPMGQASIPSNFVSYARNRLEKHGVIYEAGLTDLQHQRLEKIMRLGMATAGRLMARLKRSRGVSPAASGACSSGRNITRPRRYRRSRRAGCAAYMRTVIMKAESTARPRPQPEPNALMSACATPSCCSKKPDASCDTPGGTSGVCSTVCL
eukprot:COSAG05_NODE_1527_length_4634_cov_4.068137_5_plen_296_part_01